MSLVVGKKKEGDGFLEETRPTIKPRPKNKRKISNLGEKSQKLKGE